MDGRRARIYSRVRKNLLDPADNDITRGARQQEVIEAMTKKIVGPHDVRALPFIGDDLAKPLDDRPVGRPVPAARLGAIPRRTRAARSTAASAASRSRSAASLILGGEENTRRARDVHRPLDAAAPPPGALSRRKVCRIGYRLLG